MKLHEGDMLPPSVCTVCGGRNLADQFVDTLLNFDPGVVTHLNGRKYICETCVGTAATLLGYEKGEQVQAAQLAQAEAERKFNVLQDRVQELSEELSLAVPEVVADEHKTTRRRVSKKA